MIASLVCAAHRRRARPGLTVDRRLEHGLGWVMLAAVLGFYRWLWYRSGL